MAYTVVGLNWLFITLFVAISVPIHTHGSDYYEQLDGVSLTFFCFRKFVHFEFMFCFNSTGVGSAISTTQNDMPVNISGCG